MKKRSLKLAGLILFCLATATFGAETAKTDDTVPLFVRSFNAADDFGPWIKHGKLIIENVQFNSWNIDAYAYQGSSGKWITLQNNIQGINEFLKEEINTKEAVKSYLDEQLAHFLWATMSGSLSSLIDQRFVAWLGETHHPFLSVPSAAQITKLKTYGSDSKATVVKNNWTLNINMLNRFGGVERWSVTGQVEPFQISSFKTEIAEPNGTYPESGGIGG